MQFFESISANVKGEIKFINPTTIPLLMLVLTDEEGETRTVVTDLPGSGFIMTEENSDLDKVMKLKEGESIEIVDGKLKLNSI